MVSEAIKYVLYLLSELLRFMFLHFYGSSDLNK